MVYTPLTQAEQEEMKATGTPPGWMYEFFSLPNVAIPLSYFCIGIALQLLRTPLIVYLIEDLNATAAEVNVLFTVSKLLLLTLQIPVVSFSASDKFLTSTTTTYSCFTHYSGRPMVFQSHLWIFVRLCSHFWHASKTIFHVWMGTVYSIQLYSRCYTTAVHWNGYSLGIYTNGRVHVSRRYDRCSHR
jgi:hypothetical protein